MIAIIDYSAGNLRSVVNAIRELGHEPIVTSSPEDVDNAAIVILPGVGAAAATMHHLNNLGLAEPIRRRIAADKPFFGVCIGLQVLFSATDEGGGDCLNVISGRVKKLSGDMKIPHMGWNQVKQKRAHPVFEGIPDETNFYFVHSYYGQPDNTDEVAGTTEYGLEFCSVITRGNLLATQFHPEKSGVQGLKIYDNFIRMALAV
jgi:imidazole glycerol-phosphate synthase subunit HisH